VTIVKEALGELDALCIQDKFIIVVSPTSLGAFCIVRHLPLISATQADTPCRAMPYQLRRFITDYFMESRVNTLAYLGGQTALRRSEYSCLQQAFSF
jgi:hypothetical protein